MRMTNIEYKEEYKPPAPQWALEPTTGRLDYTSKNGRTGVTGASGVKVSVKSGAAYEHATADEGTVLQVVWNDGMSTRSVALVLTPEDAETLAQQLHASVLNGLAVRYDRARYTLEARIKMLQRSRGVYDAAVEAVRGTQMLIGTPDTTMPQRLWDKLVKALDAFDKSWRSPEYRTTDRPEYRAGEGEKR